MHLRWKIAAAAAVATAAVAVAALLIVIHGLNVQRRARELQIASLRIATDSSYRADRPSLDQLCARLADPSQLVLCDDTLRLIASYGRSPKSSEALLQFICRKLPSDMLRFVSSKKHALELLGVTGGPAEMELLKQIFLGPSGSIPTPLETWWRESRSSRQYASDGYFALSARATAATALMISGPEGDKLVRGHFFERRDQFEKKDWSSGNDPFLFMLIESLAAADNVTLLGPTSLFLAERDTCIPPLNRSYRKGAEYLPRTSEFEDERRAAVEAQRPDLVLAFKTGLRDLWVH